MNPPPDDPKRIAKRMLKAGHKAPEIERALTDQGVDPATATQIVEDAVQARMEMLSTLSAPPPARPFSWLRIVLGLVFAALAFAGMYIGLVNTSEGNPLALGALPGTVRGIILAFGAALAIASLNLIRSELMLLWGQRE